MTEYMVATNQTVEGGSPYYSKTASPPSYMMLYMMLGGFYICSKTLADFPVLFPNVGPHGKYAVRVSKFRVAKKFTFPIVFLIATLIDLFSHNISLAPILLLSYSQFSFFLYVFESDYHQESWMERYIHVSELCSKVIYNILISIPLCFCEINITDVSIYEAVVLIFGLFLFVLGGSLKLILDNKNLFRLVRFWRHQALLDKYILAPKEIASAIQWYGFFALTQSSTAFGYFFYMFLIAVAENIKIHRQRMNTNASEMRIFYITAPDDNGYQSLD
ncbi:unnamed protein product [Caenorhabditis nigoni]